MKKSTEQKEKEAKQGAQPESDSKDEQEEVLNLIVIVKMNTDRKPRK